VGYTPLRVSSPDVSYRELTFEAAQRAYADAEISTDEIDSAVCCEEDFFEGVSISDEYTPDQLGVVLKPVETVAGDGLHGLAVGAMQIQTGMFDVVVVEAHSKASNILTFEHIQAYALDPVWNRPLGIAPNFVAGLDMSRYLHESGSTVSDCDEVVATNRTRALANPIAAYAGRVELADVARSPESFSPLKKAHEARLADGAVVVVLASEERAQAAPRPVWIRGTGWANASSTLESRAWGTDGATPAAAELAFEEAGLTDPSDEVDLFEVDDTYAYRQLMTLEALGAFGVSGKANLSGGSLGMGLPLDAIGLYRAALCVEAIRAGRAGVALAQAWRGVPTTSSAIAIFGADRG
jgi:acetyl-CoA C-acetyltransferase